MAEPSRKYSDTTLMRATILAKDRFGPQAALDDAQAAEVNAHSEVDQATADLPYENQQLGGTDDRHGRASPCGHLQPKDDSAMATHQIGPTGNEVSRAWRCSATSRLASLPPSPLRRNGTASYGPSSG